MFVMFGTYKIRIDLIDTVLCTEINEKWTSIVFLKDNTYFKIEAKSKFNAVKLNEQLCKDMQKYITINKTTT